MEGRSEPPAAVAAGGSGTSVERITHRSEELHGETAVVLLQPELADQLRAWFVGNDPQYGREVTRRTAAGFESPDSVFVRFRCGNGDVIPWRVRCRPTPEHRC